MLYIEVHCQHFLHPKYNHLTEHFVHARHCANTWYPLSCVVLTTASCGGCISSEKFSYLSSMALMTGQLYNQDVNLLLADAKVFHSRWKVIHYAL